MAFSIFIPARYDSTRLPGKVLMRLAGKTLLQHAYECALKAKPDRIIIATDHYKIAAEARKIGAEVVVTPSDCPNGTARIAHALNDKANNLHFDSDDIIVNLQADEVIIPDSYIQLVAYNLSINTTASMATLAKPIKTTKDLLNHNIVKVVKNKQGMAIYFSRAAIPYLREGFSTANFSQYKFWHHIGLYAYKVGFLKSYNKLSTSEIEHAECLEQLRVLWHGHQIHIGEVDDLTTCEINTLEDFKAAELLFE